MAEIPPVGLIIGLRVNFYQHVWVAKEGCRQKGIVTGLDVSNRGRFTENEMACSVLEGQLARLVNITEVKANLTQCHVMCRRRHSRHVCASSNLLRMSKLSHGHNNCSGCVTLVV